MKRKNKGKIRWPTLVYVFPCCRSLSHSCGWKWQVLHSQPLCGQGRPCAPRDDLRKRLQDRREDVWEWFSCQIMGERTLMSACSCFLPVWSSCSGLSCGHEGKLKGTVAMLTQSHDVVNYGPIQDQPADLVTWRKQTHIDQATCSQVDYCLQTKSYPIEMEKTIFMQKVFDWLANEINLKVLPPLMASTMIFTKDFKYVCFIYIV